MLTFGSLFAGIGGLDLGLERAGMRCAWQVEIDDYASRVLAKHWPNVQRFRDVRECGAHNLEPVDLVCGGFPCQPHSLAGKRLGSQDDRDLWGEFARVIRELAPRWVLAENVPGVRATEAGRYFGRVLRDLAQSGYDAEWDCLPAAALGAPHLRDRVFIVAYTAGMLRTPVFGPQPVRAPSSATTDTDGWESLSEQEPLARRAATPDVGGHGPLWLLANADGELLEESREQQAEQRTAKDSWWAIEPDVGRVAYGVPARMDRLRCLGNAVMPQVAEFIGRCILAAEAEPTD